MILLLTTGVTLSAGCSFLSSLSSTQPLPAITPLVVKSRPTWIDPFLSAATVSGPPASSGLNDLNFKPYVFLRPTWQYGRVRALRRAAEHERRRDGRGRAGRRRRRGRVGAAPAAPGAAARGEPHRDARRERDQPEGAGGSTHGESFREATRKPDYFYQDIRSIRYSWPRHARACASRGRGPLETCPHQPRRTTAR